jgi:hypothetical protein
MSSDNHNSTVWQGYVAAVASLAQSMLFLMAVLTIALMQIAQQIGTGDPTQPISKTGKESPKHEPLKPAVSSAASSKPDTAHLKIVFVRDAIELDKAQRKELASPLASISLKPDECWLLWTEYSKEDAGMQREAYLRLLAIRSVMIGNGVKDALIDLKLVKKEGALAHATEMNVYVDPVPKTGDTLR